MGSDPFKYFGMIGYGEVGGILSAALKEKGVAVAAWDLLMAQDAMKAKARSADVEACESSAALMAKAEVVICAVTAADALAAAKEAAKAIRPGTYYLDLNSASPCTKQQCAKAMDAAGAHYVEAGVMTSVPPYGIKVPMVVGGARAKELAVKLAPFGFAMEVVSETIGVASAIKMCRSVMIKGLEAIFIESYTTARRYGVEARVLESFKETFPDFEWEKQGAYFYSRVVKHGKRRAEEMREAAVTVREAGFDPFMAAATAEKQDQVAKLAAKGVFAGISSDADWREYADRVIQSQQDQKKTA
jgi:3-hydroxyisobutyrate dehydrogenase-like beta-hydroxyacid dehydrogenase